MTDASQAPAATAPAGTAPTWPTEPTEPTGLAKLVDEPAKVMRIGTMIRQLLEEVKAAPLDERSRTKLAEIHERSLKELEDGLSPELQDELRRITLPLSDTDDAQPTESELRIAQAQLVGWLEGLFRGIQTAIAANQAHAQHLAARLQMRQLPPGTVIAPGVIIGEDGEPVRQTSSSPKPPGTQEKHDGDAPSPGQHL